MQRQVQTADSCYNASYSYGITDLQARSNSKVVYVQQPSNLPFVIQVSTLGCGNQRRGENNRGNANSQNPGNPKRTKI